MNEQKPRFYEFGPFRLDAVRHLLLRNGASVPLTPKAFETLLVLVQRPGQLVEKEDLLKEIWPDTFVEEGSLARNVSMLRRVLGEGPSEHQYIETVPRRGYRFVANVRELPDVTTSLVVEKHTFARIVTGEVEEIGATDQSALTYPSSAIPAGVGARWSRLKLAALASGIVLLIVVAAGLLWRRAASRSSNIQSIAVLPLANLSGDPQQDYFADAITDLLATDLGQVAGLRVISLQSATQYKHAHKTPPEIGRELNVDAVIEGSVQRVGGRVRINAQLVDTTTDRYVWAKSYERELGDVFQLQDDVARDVADEVQIKLTSEQRARLSRAHTVVPAANEAYLRGLFLWNQRTPETLEDARKYFQQAIDADANFALAYVGLADCYLVMTTHSGAHPNEVYPKAKEAALKALELDPMLAEAHTALAYEKDLDEWNWAEADREYHRAIELNPSYATAHHWLALHYTYLGRMEEAIAEIRRAHELDPVSQTINTNYGTLLYWGGHAHEAMEQYRKTIELAPNFPFAHYRLGVLLVEQGNYKEGLAELQVAVKLSPTASRLSYLAIGYALSGNRAEALKILSELTNPAHGLKVQSIHIAQIYLALGDKDHAFEWLERAYDDKSISESYLKVNTIFADVRSDPHFPALLKRMGLSD